MRGGPKAKISIPIYISQDIFDIGSYTPISGISETEENAETYEDVSESGETEYVESQLKTLLREKKSYDQEGNLLPFYEGDNGNELPYVIGNICNITYSGGCYYYNVLEGVKYYVEDEYGELELDEGSEGKTYYDGSMPQEGVIEFIYRVGNSLDEEENNGLGILYTERRRYTVEESEYNGDMFINVSEETISNPENADPEVQYAEISEVNKTYEEVAEPAFLVKENHLMGVNDSHIDTDNVHVDRGVSASYEAFNVLGEVNSIDDIEKYRDDWFRIKGKND